MTDHELKFCLEYIYDCNATRAYKAAYPYIKNDNSARTLASRLLSKVYIKEYIREQLDRLHSEKTADAAEVIEYLTSVLRGKSESEVVVVEGTGEGCSEARKISKNPDEKERLKAAELLGKYHAIFTDRAKVENSGVVQIVDDIK